MQIQMPTYWKLSVRSVWYLGTILCLSLLTLLNMLLRNRIIKSCFEVSYLSYALFHSIGFRSLEYF